MVVGEHGSQLNKFADYACTMLARDWKGFSTYASNAVLEENNSNG